MDADNVYGYDSAYTTSNEFSLGSAHKVTVDAATGANSVAPTATFTFTGTGFDVISLTDNTSGAITVTVKDSTGAKVKSLIVNNYYGYTYTDGQWEVVDSDSENALYQVPVMKVTGLTYGTYSVEIKAVYMGMMDQTGDGHYSFWMDAIRIYNPAKAQADVDGTTVNGAYEKDGESNPTFLKVKDILVDADTFTTGIASGNNVTGAMFIDGITALQDAQIGTYENQGPNNEAYLKNGQGIAFKLKATSSENPSTFVQSVQIGAKLADGSAAKLYYNYNELTSLATATNMFYKLNDITWADNGDGTWTSSTIVLSCSAENMDHIISLTDLKITASTQATIEPYADQEVQTFSLRVMRDLYVEIFEPEKFEVSWTGSTVGIPSVLTVKTSEDVESILINGEEITDYRTVTYYTGSWRNPQKVTYRVFTYKVTTEEAGTYEYVLRAVNAEGVYSEITESTLTVKESAIVNWLKKWVS